MRVHESVVTPTDAVIRAAIGALILSRLRILLVFLVITVVIVLRGHRHLGCGPVLVISILLLA